MENLPMEGNIRVEISLYFTIYSEYMDFLDAESNIPKKKKKIYAYKAREYEVFTSASHIVSNSKTESPS